jgi:hypothetical protein
MGFLPKIKKKEEKKEVKEEEVVEEKEPEKPIEEVEEEKKEEPEIQMEEKPKEKILVVKELPTQPIRQFKNEGGEVVRLITVEEALTEFINQ